jgi:hypothetical protein
VCPRTQQQSAARRLELTRNRRLLNGAEVANFVSLLWFDPVAQLVEQRTFNP